MLVAPPVGSSDGIFTVTSGPDPQPVTVTLDPEFDPIDSTGSDHLAGMIRAAFGQSLESLRRHVERPSWDQT